MSLPYADLAAGQEALRGPDWRSPQSLGLPSRVPGTSDRLMTHHRIIKAIAEDPVLAQAVIDGAAA